MPSLLFETCKWWDSPYINHFLSADTVTPTYVNPQDLNRFSYVLNNPLRYTDPTGNRACGDGEDIDCSGHKQDPNQDPYKPKLHKDKHDHGPNWGKVAKGVGILVALSLVVVPIGIGVIEQPELLVGLVEPPFHFWPLLAGIGYVAEVGINDIVEGIQGK